MIALRSIALACALLPAGASAQSVAAGGVFETYEVAEPNEVRLTSMRLTTWSFSARAPVRGGLDVLVDAAHASANMVLPNGDDAAISGLVDTRISLVANWRAAWVRAAALLPTGEPVGSVDDAMVVGTMSSNLLPFAVQQWSSGGGFGGDVGVDTRIFGDALSVSAGYVRLRESPLMGPETATFRPGGQFRARATYDAAVGRASVVTGMLGIQRFTEDSFAGDDVFQAGVRMEGSVSFAFALGPRESGLLYGGYYSSAAGSSPPGAFYLGATDKAARSVASAGFELSLLRGRLDVLPAGEARLVRSEDGLGQGWSGSLGARARYQVHGNGWGNRTLIEPSISLSMGRLVPSDGAASAVTGLSAGLRVRWEAGR